MTRYFPPPIINLYPIRFTHSGNGATTRKIPLKCEKWCLRVVQQLDVNQFINLNLMNILGGRIKYRWFLDGIVDTIKLCQADKGVSYDWLRLSPLIRHSVVAPVTATYSDDEEYTQAYQAAAAMMFSMIDAQVQSEFKAHQTKVENDQVTAAAAMAADAGADAAALDAGVDPLAAVLATVSSASTQTFILYLCTLWILFFWLLFLFCCITQG